MSEQPDGKNVNNWLSRTAVAHYLNLFFSGTGLKKMPSRGLATH